MNTGRLAGSHQSTLPPTAALHSIFARFWPLTKSLRSRFFIILALAVISPAVSTVGIGMFKVLIDQIVVPHNLRLFPKVIFIYFALTLLQGSIGFVERYLSAWVGGRFVMILRMQLFNHLHRQSPAFFERRPLGDLLARLTGDISSIEGLVLSGLAQCLTYVVKLIMFAGALFCLDWRLASAALAVAPVFLVATRVFSGRIKRVTREKRRLAAALTSHAEETLNNAALVRAYHRAEAEGAAFHRRNLAMCAAQLATTRLQGLFAGLTDLIEVTGVLAVIGLAVWELMAGRITIGGVLAFMAYTARLYGPIKGLSGITNSLYSASAGAERVIEILDKPAEIIDTPRPTPLGRATGAIRLCDVSFRYPGCHRPALCGVDLEVAAGQTVAVVGASGAGKSTLAKLLLRFHDPDRGSITLDGVDLRKLRLDELYRNVATVLQETLVFDATVRENILWGRPEATDQEIIAAAEAADAHEFILDLPSGYDTRVGQRGRLLSGGQRQRLAIARAIIRDAPVLLMDEPATGLDVESSRRVLGSLRRLITGRTTIIVAHNLLMVTECDVILYLESGRVAGLGTHLQLLSNSPGYRQLYHLHQQPTRRVGRVALAPST